MCNKLAIEEEPTTNHGVRTLHPCRLEESMGDGHLMAADIIDGGEFHLPDGCGLRDSAATEKPQEDDSSPQGRE